MSDMSMSDPTVVVEEKITTDDVLKWAGADWKRFAIYSAIVLVDMFAVSIMWKYEMLGWVPDAVKLIFNVGG